jgi:cytochrome c6
VSRQTPAPAAATPAAGAIPTARLADASLAEGQRLFRQTCAVCHGDDGKGGHTGGATLDRVRDFDAAIRTVTDGRGTMPSFRSAFTPAQIRDVSAYVVERLATRP